MDEKPTPPEVAGARLPPSLVDGLLRLCQGEFSHRLPRSYSRDQDDTIAFFVNTIGEELGRILAETRTQEERLALLVERVSDALLSVVAGDFSVQIARDFSGDAPDVLAFLVNNTVTELGIFVTEARRKSDEEKKRLEQLVAERTAELERLATTDVLTGALNRRRVFELADAELARAARYHHPICLAMLDLDHFKSINDRFGHAAGDDALRAVAEVVRANLRSVDLFGRYGGEELMLVLPETTAGAAAIALERIRGGIAALTLLAGDLPVVVNVSGGVVEIESGESLEAGLRRADAALYQAKHTGRNRIIVG
ncbi:MAG TPA: GGDEF domain-containing protein [Polyangia bacterium]